MIIDVVVGFLGSGKTTFILGVIAAVSAREKLAVIVNEFGDIGIDGAVLSQDGTEVVELSSGCICCTLSKDLVRQVEMLALRYNPARLLIEPSGVATVSSLLQALRSLKLEKYVEEVRIICIIDAVNFTDLYQQNRLYLEQQMRAASLIIINKMELIKEDITGKIISLATSLNSRATVIATSFCRISADDYLNIREKDLKEIWEGELSSLNEVHEHEHEHEDESLAPLPFTHDLEKFSLECSSPLAFHSFNSFLGALQRGEMGEVVRAKGIVFLDERGWVNFNLASGYVSIIPMKKAQAAGKLFVAGKNLDQEMLLACLEGCRSEDGLKW